MSCVVLKCKQMVVVVLHPSWEISLLILSSEITQVRNLHNKLQESVAGFRRRDTGLYPSSTQRHPPSLVRLAARFRRKRVEFVLCV